MKKIFQLFFAIIFLVVISLNNKDVSLLLASSPFSQTDWSGGAVPSGDTSTEYDNNTDIDTSVAGDFSLERKPNEFLNPSLDTNADEWYFPEDIDNLQIHLDASAITGLSNGDPVSLWSDISGKGNDATEALVSAQPAYITNVANGHPVVRFTLDDDLVIPSVTLGPRTYYIVVKKNGADNQYHNMIFHGSSPFYQLAASYTGEYFFSNPPITNTSGDFLETFQMIRMENPQAGRVDMYQNSNKIMDNISHNAGSPDEGDIEIGRYLGNPSSGLNGDIAEILIYDRDLTDSEGDMVSIYLANKYGLPFYGADWLSDFTEKQQVAIIEGNFTKDEIVADAGNNYINTIGEYLSLDFDASQITGVLDGLPFATWSDQSPHGYNAIQNTLINQPLYIENQINGEPVVRFDGVDDSLVHQMPEFTTGDDYSIISVAHVPSGAQQPLLGTKDATGPGTSYGMVNGAFRWQNEADGNSINSSADFTNAVEVRSYLRNTSNIFIEYINGLSVYSNTLSGTMDFGAIGSRLGAVAPLFLDGDIANITIFNTDIIPLSRAKIETSLAKKYNITVSNTYDVLEVSHQDSGYNGTLGSVHVDTSSTKTYDFTQKVTPIEAGDYVLSVYVKNDDNSEVTSAHAELVQDSLSVSTTYTSAGDDWYRLEATFTTPATSSFGVRIKSDSSLSIDELSLAPSLLYEAAGVLTSNIYDSENALGSAWGEITLDIENSLTPIDPSTVSGLRLRLDASTIVGLSDGEDVDVWEDSSGNGFDANAQTATIPLYKTGILNGNPIVRFNEAENFLANVGSLDAPFDVFLVGYFDYTNQPSNNYDHVVSIGDGKLNTSTVMYRNGNNTFKDKFSVAYNANQSIVSNTVIQGREWNIYTQKLKTSLPYFSAYIDAVNVGLPSDYPSSINTNGDVFLGRWYHSSYPQSSNFFKGDIAELIIYDEELSASDTAGIEEYLNEKYDLYTSRGVEVRVRTSNDSGMSGAPAFSTCTPVSSGEDISANNCVTDGHRYLQYEVTQHSPHQDISPVFKDISISFDSALNAPQVVTSFSSSFVSDNEVSLSWDDVNTGVYQEDNYHISRSINGGSFDHLATIGADTSSYSDTTTASNAKYTYKIYGENTAGSSTSVTSNDTYTTTADPSGAVVSNVSTTSVDISWTDNASYEDSYVLNYTQGKSETQTLPLNTVTYSDTALSPNISYISLISSKRNDRGESGTDFVSFTTLAQDPTGLVSMGTSSDTLSFSWNSVSADTYKIELVENGFSSGWISGTEYSFSGLSCNKTYTAELTARNSVSVETSSIYLIVNTDSCMSSGGSYLPPRNQASKNTSSYTNATLRINNDVLVTYERDVLLTFSHYQNRHPSVVRIANNANFVDSKEYPYPSSSLQPWRLVDGEGYKTVYVQFLNSSRDILTTISDSILYEIPKENTYTKRPVTPKEEPVIQVSNIDENAVGYGLFKELQNALSVEAFKKFLTYRIPQTLLNYTTYERSLMVDDLNVIIPRIVYNEENISNILYASLEGSISVESKLQVSPDGVPEQRIHVLSGRTVTYHMRPKEPVSSIVGYLVFHGANIQARENEPHLSLFKTAQAQSKEKKEKQEFVVDTFVFTDEDGDGEYSATIVAPVVEGDYEVLAEIQYLDDTKNNELIRLVTIVDPEGYVYEKIKGREARIENVKITLYEKKQDGFVLWNAGNFLQNNPQRTGRSGMYAFLVPPGEYYLQAYKEDYEEYIGEVFSIKEGRPVHMNIEMKKEIQWMEYLTYGGGVLLILIIGLLSGLYIRRKKE